MEFFLIMWTSTRTSTNVRFDKKNKPGIKAVQCHSSDWYLLAQSQQQRHHGTPAFLLLNLDIFHNFLVYLFLTLDWQMFTDQYFYDNNYWKARRVYKMWCFARFGAPWTILKTWKTLINECSISNTPPWVFFTLFNLYKWRQIAQNVSNTLASFW